MRAIALRAVSLRIDFGRGRRKDCVASLHPLSNLIAIFPWVRTVAAAALAAMTPAQVIARGKDDRLAFQIVIFPFYKRILGVHTCFCCGVGGCSCIQILNCLAQALGTQAILICARN